MCVFVCALRLYAATPGWGVRRGCVRLGSGFSCAPPLLAGVLGVCVCWCARSACTPPLLTGMCGVGVCALARVVAAPRHSWPGCVCFRVHAPLVPRHSWLSCAVWVCVFGLGFHLHRASPGWGVWVCVFVCALSLYPATPGRGVRPGCVCSGSGFGCALPLLCGACLYSGARSACTPPLLAELCGVGVCVWARVSSAPGLFWLGCWGVRVCVRPMLVPRHSWLGCAVCVCVLGLGFRLRPATPGPDVGVCVCLCAQSAGNPPLLAEVCCVGVCAWARVWSAPRLSWLGCWGVCAFVCALRLCPATPGWGMRCGCVCLGPGLGCTPPLLARVSGSACARSACTPPLLAGVCCVGVCAWAPVSAAPCLSWLGCWGVCVFVCVLHLCPATPGWGVQCGCMCLASGFGCALPLLVRVVGSVCPCVRALPVPRHSWLGCAVLVCVPELGFRLRPATPGCGVGVCAFVCSLRLYPGTPGPGLRCVGCVSTGTCSCAVVRCVLFALPGFAAPGGRCCFAPARVPWLWPAACLSGVPCGPALVRRASSGPVALGAPVGFFRRRGAFLHPRGAIYWAAARCKWWPAENWALCACRWPPPRLGLLARSAPYPFGALQWGRRRRVPPGSVTGCVCCGGLACVDPVTDASVFLWGPSFNGGPGRCTGAVSCGC